MVLKKESRSFPSFCDSLSTIKYYRRFAQDIIFYTMIFDIATFKIKIQNRKSSFFNFPESFYKDYGAFISDKKGPCDFTITIVPNEKSSLLKIKLVRRQSHYYYENKREFIIKSRYAAAYINIVTKNIILSFRDKRGGRKKIYILMAFLRLAISICAVLKGGIPLHSSAIAFGDRGIAFSGPSGGGKSTIANLLISSGQLLNDDFNVILPHKKKAYAIYSTPFTKKEALQNCIKRGVMLATIFFIEKSLTNAIENLSFKYKYIYLLGQTFIFPLSDFFGQKILDNAERLCGSVECKRLHFKNDETIRPFIYHHAGGSLT